MTDLTRFPHLAQIDAPADLRRVPDDELPAVADELREFLIGNGNHVDQAAEASALSASSASSSSVST